MSGKSLAHGGEEPYCGAVPAKQPNEGGRPPAEVVEGRPQAEENTQEPDPCRTQSRESGPTGLARVRQAARRDTKQKFTALLCHVSIELLRDTYLSLKNQAAPGVDVASPLHCRNKRGEGKPETFNYPAICGGAPGVCRLDRLHLVRGESSLAAAAASQARPWLSRRMGSGRSGWNRNLMGFGEETG